jgi:hypothetical protein
MAAMGSTPNIPPGSIPPVPPFWREEQNWIVLIEFLVDYDEEDRARGAEAIGYMLAFAQLTNTRMLALVGDAAAYCYELLFSFDTPDHKAEFLRLIQSNEATACTEEEIHLPQQEEIDAAQPLDKVLPADVIRQVTVIAALHAAGGGSQLIQ